MKALAAALLLALPASASAAGRVLSTTGRLMSGDRVLKAGDALPASEVTIASGTATLAIDGGRFLLKGPASLTHDDDSLRLDRGSLLSVLRLKRDKKFYVRTPIVVAAVRGTDFWVEVGPKQEVEICICRGALNVLAKDAQPFALKAPHHLSYGFKTGDKGVVRAKAAMQGHTDSELDVLRGLLPAEKP